MSTDADFVTPSGIDAAVSELAEARRQFFTDGFFTEPPFGPHREAVPLHIRRRLMRDEARRLRLPFIVVGQTYSFWAHGPMGGYARLDPPQRTGLRVIIPHRKLTMNLVGRINFNLSTVASITGQTVADVRVPEGEASDILMMHLRQSEAAEYVRETGVRLGYPNG
jgi:hypothetical protein